MPIAQNTRLGWVITGKACHVDYDCLDFTFGSQSNLCISSLLTREDNRISNALVKLWAKEQIPKKTFLTPEE